MARVSFATDTRRPLVYIKEEEVSFFFWWWWSSSREENKKNNRTSHKEKGEDVAAKRSVEERIRLQEIFRRERALVIREEEENTRVLGGRETDPDGTEKRGRAIKKRGGIRRREHERVWKLGKRRQRRRV